MFFFTPICRDSDMFLLSLNMRARRDHLARRHKPGTPIIQAPCLEYPILGIERVLFCQVFARRQDHLEHLHAVEELHVGLQLHQLLRHCPSERVGGNR